MDSGKENDYSSGRLDYARYSILRDETREVLLTPWIRGDEKDDESKA